MMKQLILTFMAVGMLATASWAGSEVETPMPIANEQEVACTYMIQNPNNSDDHVAITAASCDEARAMAIAFSICMGWVDQ